MTYLKKIIFAATLAVASIGFSLSSNAALITHDVLLDGGVVGEITVHLLDNGATGQQDFTGFEAFKFFGFDVTEIFIFGATIDRDNVFAGIEFLFFDVDVAALDAAIQGIYDVLAQTPALDNFIDVFDVTTGNPIVFGELSLSAARVVSEPSMLALFALALVGFGVRRQAK